MRRSINRSRIVGLIAMLVGSAFGVGGGCDSGSSDLSSFSGYGGNYSYVSDYGYGSSNGDYSDAVSTYLGNFVSYP